jgi:hypothetical protein
MQKYATRGHDDIGRKVLRPRPGLKRPGGKPAIPRPGVAIGNEED